VAVPRVIFQKLLKRDEARQIAPNIPKLPELAGGAEPSGRLAAS